MSTELVWHRQNSVLGEGRVIVEADRFAQARIDPAQREDSDRRLADGEGGRRGDKRFWKTGIDRVAMRRGICLVSAGMNSRMNIIADFVFMAG